MTERDPSSLYEFDPGWDKAAFQRLSRPVLVVALEGWVDAGMGASAAIASLVTASPTTVVASFDTEMLIDQRARRPVARLEDGVTTELTWPAIRVVAGKDRVGADILFLTGPEPDFRWLDGRCCIQGQSAQLVPVRLHRRPRQAPWQRPHHCGFRQKR